MLQGLIALALFLRPDIVVADFEGDDYGAWSATGTAFGSGPASGTLPNQMPVSGYQGKRLVNTFLGGDGATGTLTSPSFKIDRAYVSFLIGGGYDRQRLKVELVVDGQVERFATGSNRAPGGSEALGTDGWDVRDLEGKDARIHIVDEATGGWGHLNVDQIVLTDQKPPMIQRDTVRTIRLDRRFLNIPIKNGSPKRNLTFEVDGILKMTNSVEIAHGTPDWFASIDVSPWKGKAVTLTLDEAPANSKALASVTTSDEVPGPGLVYAEKGRGQFHFSPRRGWTNDPNGLVYYRGEYHLFFQHNPYGWGWGNMSWGHAVSPDLVHWEELPIALHPDRLGTIYSGSAVVDTRNTSGFGEPGQPPMVLLYTNAGQPFSQGLAYSTDGRTFTKYAKNPIIPLIEHDDRDPKVIWHEPTQKWVMVLYLENPERNTLQFLTSPDLKTWSPTSQIKGFYECPDLFELPVKGMPGVTKWVLTAANSDYMIGSFDGRAFMPESGLLKGHHGRGFYAAQTFSDLPGRRVQIGWFQTETKGESFNQSMSIPMELALVGDADGIRMVRTPVKELKKLRASTQRLPAFTLHTGPENGIVIGKAELAEIELEFEAEAGDVLRLFVRGVDLRYDGRTRELTVDGMKTTLPAQERVSLRLFVDRTGFEVFAAEGRVFMPVTMNLDPAETEVMLRAEEGSIKVSRAEVHTLKSAWKQ